MDVLGDSHTCRICLNKQDTVYSLFCKRNGVAPCELLSKLGVKADANDNGASSICCDCLAELEITLRFLEKCEKSNQIISEQLAHVQEFSDESACKDDVGVNPENNPIYIENGLEDGQESNIDSIADENGKNNDILSLEVAQCRECGSKRRCQHWSPPTTHTCPYCKKVFSRKFNFKLHLKRHRGERDWSCCVCGARAVTRWLAARHCKPRRRRMCPVPGCGKTYTTNINLKTHLMTHSGERPFECKECDKKFNSKNTLNSHMRIHTGALPYICPVCGKRFRTNKLSAHMSTHLSKCVCTECSLHFTSRGALARHAHAHHAPPTPRAARAPPAHACRVCPAKYHHKQSLNKHVKKQHSQLQKPVSIEMDLNDVAEEVECEMN